MDVNTWDREALMGKRVIVRREVTAVKPTREWTGHAVWEGLVTQAHDRPVHLNSGCPTVGLSVLTATEHTWLSVGEWTDGPRRWVTTVEIVHPRAADTPGRWVNAGTSRAVA